MFCAGWCFASCFSCLICPLLKMSSFCFFILMTSFMRGSGWITDFFYSFCSCQFRELGTKKLLVKHHWVERKCDLQNNNNKKNKTERERERVNEQLSVELQDSFLSHSWMRSAENRGKERKEGAVRESQRVDTVSHWMTAGLLSVQWWGLVGKWYTRKQSRNEHRLTREMRSGRGPQKWRNTRTT